MKFSYTILITAFATKEDAYEGLIKLIRRDYIHLQVKKEKRTKAWYHS